jgi:hypothetical protein
MGSIKQALYTRQISLHAKSFYRKVRKGRRKAREEERAGFAVPLSLS